MLMVVGSLFSGWSERLGVGWAGIEERGEEKKTEERGCKGGKGCRKENGEGERERKEREGKKEIEKSGIKRKKGKKKEEGEKEERRTNSEVTSRKKAREQKKMLDTMAHA